MDTTIFDQSFSAVALINKNYELDYFNNSFANLMGRSSRQLKKIQSILELFQESNSGIEELLMNTFKNNEMQVGHEMSVATPKGQHSFVMKVIPFSKDQLLLFFNDVTVERSLYEKYRQKLADLKVNHAHIIHADRLRAIGELTSNMAHEVNNPLTVAIGNAELFAFALENKNLESERANLTQWQANILESLSRIERIIHGMRQFAYKGETAKEYVAIQDVITKAVSFISPTLDNLKISLTLNLPNIPILALVDRLQIEQVLVNLLNNAKDALENVPNPSIKIELLQDRDQSMNIISVQDNGHGIASEIGDQVYQSFFSTKAQGVGTGLGLPIAKRLVEAHQGTLHHTSEKGKTIFFMSLPMIEISSFAEGTLIHQNTDDIANHKVLVIDNEVGIHNLFKNYLQESRFSIIGSTGGENVLNLMQNLTPSLIITDLIMPGIDGRDMAKKIRKLHPNVPMVYMSSQDNQHCYEEDKKLLNLTSFLVKPFTKEKLLQVISEAIKV
jgi:signal transduction histidine kinase